MSEPEPEGHVLTFLIDLTGGVIVGLIVIPHLGFILSTLVALVCRQLVKEISSIIG